MTTMKTSKVLIESFLREYRILSVELEKKMKVLRKSTLTDDLSTSELTELVDLGQRIESILLEVLEYLKTPE